jgi:ELWxxDGT repeat protein
MLKGIFSILVLVVSFFTFSVEQKVYELDPSREHLRLDSINPVFFQKYDNYLFFHAIDTFNYMAESELPVYQGHSLWRYNPSTNSAKRVVTDLQTTNLDKTRAYYVFNERILYFSLSGLVYTDLEGKIQDVNEKVKYNLEHNQENKFIEFAGFVYFSAIDAQTKTVKLWKSNGTISGTSEVPLCQLSQCFNSPKEMIVVGNKLFLVASKSANEAFIWMIEASGQSSLAYSVPVEVSIQNFFIPANNGVFFRKDSKLFFTDGTQNNSFEVKLNSKNPDVVSKDMVMFKGNLVVAQEEFIIVKANGRGQSSELAIGKVYDPIYPTNLTIFQDKVFFIGSGMDGSGRKAGKLMSLDSNNQVTEIFNFSATNDFLYKIIGTKGNKLLLLRYVRNYGDTPPLTELWVSDGTKQGTHKISDSGSPIQVWDSQPWIETSNDFYFAGFTPSTGLELWKTDGSEKGTELVKDIAFSLLRSNKGNLTSDKQSLYHFIKYQRYGRSGTSSHIEIWQTDLQQLKSTLIQQLPENSFELYTEFKQRSDGFYLWLKNSEQLGISDLMVFDKQQQKLNKIKTLNYQSCLPNWDGQFTELVVGNKYYFVAKSLQSQSFACQLWVTDGTEIGTKQLTNFNIQQYENFEINKIFHFGNKIYFTVNSNEDKFLDLRTTLFSSNGIDEGATKEFDLANYGEPKYSGIGQIIVSKNGLFITSNGSKRLWFWDGTQVSLVRESAPEELMYSPVPFEDGIAFIEANQLYIANSRPQGSAAIIALKAGSGDYPRLTSFSDNNRLFFTMRDDKQQIRLWQLHGSSRKIEPMQGSLISFDFKVMAESKDDVYVSELLYTFANIENERLHRFSLLDGSKQEIFRIRTSGVASDIRVHQAQSMIFISSRVRLPSYGGPYVTAKLDDGDFDKDGVLNSADLFPFHSMETKDLDQDGIGANSDEDDDGDMVVDRLDAFPTNPIESRDSDLDNIGDNADPDDDNDGFSDWLDAYPHDNARNSNQIVLPTPPADKTPPSASKGGGASHFGWTLFLLVLLVLRMRRQMSTAVKC